VEAVLTERGHVVIGVADTTVDAVHLVEHGHPDLVIVDPAVGCNTDFDVIETACQLGAATVVFSRSAGDLVAGRYRRPPIIVPKPDLVMLELAIGRLGHDGLGAVAAEERRVRAGRASSGPRPTGVHDAAAFYSALNEAAPGDSLVAVVPVEDLGPHLWEQVATRMTALVRDGDRVLVTGWAVVVFLPGSGDEGAGSLVARTGDDAVVGAAVRLAHVVVQPAEVGADALARLKALA
jgi:hypothetical protein